MQKKWGQYDDLIIIMMFDNPFSAHHDQQIHEKYDAERLFAIKVYLI